MLRDLHIVNKIVNHYIPERAFNSPVLIMFVFHQVGLTGNKFYPNLQLSPGPSPLAPLVAPCCNYKTGFLNYQRKQNYFSGHKKKCPNMSLCGVLNAACM